MSEAQGNPILFEIEVLYPQQNEEGESDERSSGSEGDDEYEQHNSDSSNEDDDDLYNRYTDPIPELGVNQENLQLYMYGGAEEDDHYQSEEIHSDISEGDDNEGKNKRMRWPQFNENVQYGNVSFELGMEFRNLAVFKQAVRDYAVNEGVQLKFVKNDAERCRVKCVYPCPWKIFCSLSNETQTFQVKTFMDEHNCSRTLTTQQASSKWLAVRLLPFLRINSKPLGNDVVTYIKETFCLNISTAKAYRAWKRAKILMEGSERAQYKRLRDYCWEILRSNPGSKCQVGIHRISPTSPPIFNRMYMCLHACKTGFLVGCRPIIGLDGCFLKGYYGGQLLSAVGQDGDNGFYPIDVAVVETESRETWSWFLRMLLDDIGEGPQGRGWSFITDRQKGLVPTIAEMSPTSEHRLCVYHIYSNYAKNFKGRELRDFLWDCAKSTTMQDFTSNMKKLKEFNSKAWEYLSRIPPQQWTRAAFDTYSKSQVYTNNMCEQFNSKIVEARGKPILTMMEEIRLYIMRKMIIQRNRLQNFRGPLCPKVRDKLEGNKRASRFWVPQWVGDPNGEKFKVCSMPDKYVVDLGARSCSCRSWDLCGVPCAHAIAALGWRNFTPEDYVHSSLTRETFEKVYEPYIQPVNGQNLWPHDNDEEIEPPEVKKKRGRPKKQRKKDLNEKERTTKSTKLGKRLPPTCRKCNVTGHNSRSCNKRHNGTGGTSSVEAISHQEGSTMNHQGAHHVMETQESTTME